MRDCNAIINELRQEIHDFGPLVAHGSYTMNLCSAKPETRANGLDMLKQDLLRMELLPGNLYNFHPGSHTGQGVEIGIAQIAEALNQILWPEMQTTVLLETMAGKGSEIGGTFEELREIIDRVELKDKIGVCFDTCHTWDAGGSTMRTEKLRDFCLTYHVSSDFILGRDVEEASDSSNLRTCEHERDV